MNDDEPLCECTGPGWCHRYQIEQQAYPFEVCQRNDYNSKRYRKKWRLALLKEAGDGPSLAKRGANFLAAMSRAAAAGFQKVPLDVLETRQQLCDSCDFHNRDRGICIHPGCGCPVRRDLRGGAHRPSKLELISESCPMGRWGVHTPE